MEKKKCSFTRKMGIDLFVEFQQKIRNFAADLNGVLNCSEAAIRHARVVQEWATSVQLMFEQIKDERQKILNYIDERERNMLIAKEQFIAELREQGAQLKQLVEEMKTYRELRDNGEKYCKTKVDDGSQRKSLDETIIDVLLRKRLEEDRSIILSLSKQSKISEMKLFIIHQQSCIQQLQEQNNELKAIIEGLMGPDELEVCEPPTKQQGSSGLTPLLSPLSTPDLQMKEEEEICDTDQSGTPASVSTPDRCPVRDTLDRIEDPSLSLVSDVLHCDRGEYLPGTSTDGDVATVQAYAIGNHSDRIDGGDKVVFDPLTVPYVREQCQLAEESERRAHAASNIEVEDVSKVQLSAESDIQMLQNGVEALNMEPYLRKCSEEERIYEAITEDHEAAGDGVDVTSQKISLESPEKTSESEIPPENVGIESNLPPVGVIADIPPPISPL